MFGSGSLLGIRIRIDKAPEYRSVSTKLVDTVAVSSKAPLNGGNLCSYFMPGLGDLHCLQWLFWGGRGWIIGQVAEVLTCRAKLKVLAFAQLCKTISGLESMDKVEQSLAEQQLHHVADHDVISRLSSSQQQQTSTPKRVSSGSSLHQAWVSQDASLYTRVVHNVQLSKKRNKKLL